MSILSSLEKIFADKIRYIIVLLILEISFILQNNYFSNNFFIPLTVEGIYYNVHIKVCLFLVLYAQSLSKVKLFYNYFGSVRSSLTVSAVVN